ncbi:hypothetical protein M199_gp215 [Halogranum tailed virus 1]|uniref:Uncharacterized protein n=1 Tax=Halogranum tailed virus 1 TaxID=1273749 RepID=R4TGS3_9CAUD|nr:hypothetical protein M199_gp215 [Halogranum tailed virus 1]AGM11451.1 hypothetical protein HGTV1_154 [Halogranum tailed virus 1]
MKGLNTIWEDTETERPEASNKFLIGILSLKSAYEKGDEDLILDSLEYLVVEAQYDVLDVDREYTFTRTYNTAEVLQ